MRTTVELPNDLVAEAMRVSHARTKTMAITRGLEELINRYRIEALRALRGKIELTTDLRKSRGR